MSLTHKMLEDCYSNVMAGDHKSYERTFIMSWNQFQIMYGEQGERLRRDYEVVDVLGRAQVQPKQLTDAIEPGADLAPLEIYHSSNCTTRTGGVCDCEDR